MVTNQSAIRTSNLSITSSNVLTAAPSGLDCAVGWFGLVLVIALRPQTPKHKRSGWSHYTDTSEPVDGNGAQNMVTVPFGFESPTF
jgi:hypothetical protein